MSRGSHLTTTDLHRLDLAVLPLHRMIDDLDGPCGIYLVGSATERDDYRDVDVRMILADPAFDLLFGGKPELWAAFSYAVSRWLAADTGLPIDFQVQRMTEANERFTGTRNPLSGGRHREFAGLGDATPYYIDTLRASGNT